MASQKFDFSDVPVIDTHVHGPMAGTEPGIFGTNEYWNNLFAERLMPSKGGSGELLNKIRKGVDAQQKGRLGKITLARYLGRKYGLKPNAEQIEKYLIAKIKKEGIKKYATRAFKSARIKWSLADHSFITEKPYPKMDDFPEKMKWTHGTAHLLQPEWAKSNGLDDSRQVAESITEDLETAKKNECSGLKSYTAYFRPFLLEDVDEDEATGALRLLLESKPVAKIPLENHPNTTIPIYGSIKENEALRKYQDFMMRRLFADAGKLTMPVLIHVAVAVSPELKPWNNNSSDLYSVFDNDEIRRAGTDFVLIHTGFPDHHMVSSLISQYPNVYVDLSHYSLSYLSVLNTRILEEFLAVSSPSKIMHGSDGAHPDAIAFAAHNTKISLAAIAEWLYEVEHLSRNEIDEIASSVLYKSAETLFGK